MRAYQIPLYTLLLLLALAGPALAVDGVLEINQTCAISTGCFPGDSPGFPVSVTQPGSYRLTGNLDLSAEGVNVSGIAVSVSSATIDLGGFYIAGPTSCSGSGTSINCSPSTTFSKGTSWWLKASPTTWVVRSRSSRKVGSPEWSIRRIKVLTKQPISPSSSVRPRPATGEATATSACPA